MNSGAFSISALNTVTTTPHDQIANMLARATAGDEFLDAAKKALWGEK
ncbi:MULTISPECIES: hypothetical protein [Yersinia]|nr:MULTISPECIES: hypothetical protein [Yersinia]MDA5543561.1 hypothetical protein [Yersinia rochesterensis]MDN0106545.1 hypothetical protein [Yersinia rochesterensis]MDR5017731.1 hypothetical protein [Yersinia rochesterensis]UZM76521.1 hypothetical protein OP863_07860 [Yersinia sp. SCPM-O-B-9106 (C-191)]